MKPITAQKSSIIFLVGIIAFLAVNFIANSVIYSAHGGRHTPSELIASLVMQVVLLAVVLIFTLKGKTQLPYSYKFDIAPSRNKSNLIILLLIPVIALLSLFTFFGPALAFEAVLQTIGYTPPPMLEMNTPTTIVLGVILIIVFASVCEEFFVRGGLMGGLHNKYGAKYAVIVTAFAFALMHMNPSQTIFQFGLGIVIGVLTIRTKSILPAIFLHAISNAYALIMSMTPINSGIDNFINGDRLWLVILTFSVTTAVFGAILFFLFKYLFKTKPPEKITVQPNHGEGQTKEERIKAQIQQNQDSGLDRLIFYAGIGVCAFMWLMSLLTGFGVFGNGG
ncbi:MAG: CPBP family intramembrane metalloprotease [Firmicutes bacterium]|nr:CPBP family intramembrane metalloprotease [Bacillota bacterium]MCL2255794.1 CPBP family intramembrane metalloprotease [Bacillota bacterium]